MKLTYDEEKELERLLTKKYTPDPIYNLPSHTYCPPYYVKDYEQKQFWPWTVWCKDNTE